MLQKLKVTFEFCVTLGNLFVTRVDIYVILYIIIAIVKKAVDILDFGAYLKDLLKIKSVSIAELTERLSIKSKNEIYRLLNNECSFQKAAELTRKILSVIDTTDEERIFIKEYINKFKIGTKTRGAMDILSALWQNREAVYTYKIKRLDAVLKKYADTEIHIFIGRNVDINTTFFLEKYLAKNNGAKISHIVNFAKPENVIAEQLFTIVKLGKYDGYDVFETNKAHFTGIRIIINNKNSYYIAIETEQDFIESEISEELYRHIQNECMAQCKRSLKESKNKFRDYSAMLQEFHITEEENSFGFNGHYSFTEIPFDIQYRLLEDANFFGMPKNSEYITSLVNSAKQRHIIRERSKPLRRCVTSEEDIIRFFTTGRTIDYLYYFRSLNKDEINEVVKSLENISDIYQYRFFKEGYSMYSIQCELMGKGILIWDIERGYDNGHWQILIKNKKAVELYGKFADYFWESCTLPDKESREKLTKLINRYLK